LLSSKTGTTQTTRAWTKTRATWSAIALLALSFLWTAYFILPAGSRRDGEVFVRVETGTRARAIGEVLRSEGLVRSPLQFVIWARALGAEGQLQAGEYRLHPGMTPPTIVWWMKTGRVASPGVTIPEGYSLVQIADALAARGLVEREEFLALAHDAPAVLGEDSVFVPPTSSLEGYLYPDTYRIAPGTPPAAILRLMAARTAAKVLPLLDTASLPPGFGIHEVLTLASIVEKEAQVAEERPLIAGVFLRRLRLGMPLQADPTVKYVLSPAPVRLSVEDVSVDSPYNTYRYPGLPPGPIASPGLDSVRAVLKPGGDELLYFVARGDGTHVFSRSYSEHLAARKAIGAPPPPDR
jgi:UPF0755 protein